MAMSLVTPRPTTRLRPGGSSKVWSPEKLTRRKGMGEDARSGEAGKRGRHRAGPLVPRSLPPSLRARQRQRQQHRPRLGLGLPPFGGGIGVGDDAGAGLDPGPAAPHDAGADGDRGIQRAGAPADVADRAGVGSAPDRLQLVDDLHGPHLGRARHGAGGEAGGQRRDRVEVGPEPAAHLAHEVHDVGVALDRP